MSSAIACTRCGRQLQLPPELLGKPVMCPGCNLIFVPQADGTVSRPSKPAVRRPPGPSANPPASPGRPPTFKHKPKRVESLDPDDSDLPLAEIEPGSSAPGRSSASAWAGPVPPVRRRPPAEPELPTAELLGSAPAPELLSIDPEPARRRPRFRSHRRRGPDLRVPLIIGGCIGGLVIIGLVIFFTVKAFSGSGWQTFTSPEGGFTVELPGKIQTRQQVTPTPVGAVTTYMFAAEASRTEAYAIGYADYPGAILAAPPERIFDEAAASGIAGMANTPGFRGRIAEQRSINLDGHPGRETVIDIPGKGTGVLRLYLVRNRLYMLLALGKSISPSSSNVTKFFDSFKLAR